MPVDAGQVARLRRLVAEPTADSYSDADLADAIEHHPLDGGGFDLYAAAAEVWDEKAAVYAQDYDFAADGGDYKRSQAHDHALKMARLYRARRLARSVFLSAESGKAGAG